MDELKHPTSFAIDEIKESIMNHERKPINGIYIELDAVLDFKLGALLALNPTQVNHNYIWRELDKYNEAVDRTIMNHFDELPTQEVEIMNYIKDPANSLSLIVGSPMFEMHEQLYELIRYMNEDNKTRYTKDRDIDNLQLYFNCRYFDIPEVTQAIIRDNFGKLVTNKHIHFGVGVTGNKPREVLDDYNVFILHYMVEWIHAQGTTALVTKDDFYVDRHIIGVIETDFDTSTKTERELDEISKSTHTVFNMFCHFQFIKNNLAVHNPLLDKGANES